MTLAGRLDARRWTRTAGVGLASQSLLESHLSRLGSRGQHFLTARFLLGLAALGACKPHTKRLAVAGSVDSVSRRVCVGTEPGLRGAVLGFPGLVLSPVPDRWAGGPRAGASRTQLSRTWPRPALLPLHWQPRARRGCQGDGSPLRIRANSNQSASSGGSGGGRRAGGRARRAAAGPPGGASPRPARLLAEQGQAGAGVPEPARPRPRLGGPGAARAGRCRAAAAVRPARGW